MRKPKIAIVHDWLTGMRGGEKCLEAFCELFPDAALFTLLHARGSVSGTIEGMDIRTSFLQKVPGITKTYRNFLPLFPRAVESFDLKGYDLVLSSSHCVAKGARKPEGALHICYCYTPVRYVWKFSEEYFGPEDNIKRRVISYFLGKLKKWDIETNKKVDYFIAISHNVKNRIKEYYNREADVIYPPVDIAAGPAGTDKGSTGSGQYDNYYLLVSALVPYKRVDLAIKAFNENGKDLVIIGSGTEEASLRKIAKDNIHFLGWVESPVLAGFYAGCEALVFPGEEDFGIVTVEAQSFGRPVIAYSKGGALETVVPLGGEDTGSGKVPTGIFFNMQDAGSLNRAVERFEKNKKFFIPEKIKENSGHFNKERFKREIRDYVEERWRRHCAE